MSIREVAEKIKGYLAHDWVYYPVLLVACSVLSFGLGRLSVDTPAGDTQLSITPPPVQKAVDDTSMGIGATAKEPTTTVSHAASVATPVLQMQKDNTVGVGSLPGAYVASKNSDKYHLPWCSGAKRISEVNKIWFATKAEAEAAGYSPAGNCPGI